MLPYWAPVIPVVCQLPSPFFATLPQSHMEAGLRWVESTTFLLVTSKPGNLLGMAWGLALQPPSVNCSSSLLWPQWWWMAPDKLQTRFTICKCPREQLWGLSVSYWQMGQRKPPRPLFVHEKLNGRIISLTSHKMTGERGEQILLFLSPELHFKSETPGSLIEAKGKARKQKKGWEKRGHTGSWLLKCTALIEVKLLHRSTANSLEFKSEMKILAQV